jgi:hypothetical protein
MIKIHALHKAARIIIAHEVRIEDSFDQWDHAVGILSMVQVLVYGKGL